MFQPSLGPAVTGSLVPAIQETADIGRGGWCVSGAGRVLNDTFLLEHLPVAFLFLPFEYSFIYFVQYIHIAISINPLQKQSKKENSVRDLDCRPVLISSQDDSWGAVGRDRGGGSGCLSGSCCDC